MRWTGPIEKDMPDFQRLDLGEYGGHPRFYRTISFFQWNDTTNFRKYLDLLSNVKKVLVGSQFEINDGVFTFNREQYFEYPAILHYPKGGGFVNRHVDGVFEPFPPVNNLLMCVSKKGREYQDGGYFVRSGDGEEISLDDFLEPGDIYYHGNTAIHGVHSIDLYSEIDLNSHDGRVVLSHSYATFQQHKNLFR